MKIIQQKEVQAKLRPKQKNNHPLYLPNPPSSLPTKKNHTLHLQATDIDFPIKNIQQCLGSSILEALLLDRKEFSTAAKEVEYTH